ncbi:MAG: hypothetical protein H6742_16045 [Alphaproteobacteria bacterium]|nr:hypothetical protein [Alphaproteobacteria bacterium]
MNRIHATASLALVPLALLASAPAAAVEVDWEGHYRAESHIYDSLSLSKTNAGAEGTSAWFDHRFRLRPGFLLSDKVGVYTQLDMLQYVRFGQEVAGRVDLTQGTDLPLVYTDDVQAPTTTDGAVTTQNIAVSRLWAEAWLGDIAKLRFGRVPLHWGTGMVWNDGNSPSADFGDTEDRVELTGRVGPVYLMGAFGVPYEGLVNQGDDMRAISGSVAHITEQAGVGFYNTYKWQSYEEDKLGLWIGDLWGRAALGPVTVDGEFAAVLGSGDLGTGVNDVSISAFGANLGGMLEADKLELSVRVGLAGGDKDDTDKKLHTFSFDPDHDLALLMFEQPMPVLAAAVPTDANEGRNVTAVRTGNGLSNAVYLKPTVGWKWREDLTTRASFFAAQAAKLPEETRADKGYGSEIDLNVDYRPYEHFRLDGTFGVFFPGKYYRNYEDDTLGGGFDRTAVGGRVQAIVEF